MLDLAQAESLIETLRSEARPGAKPIDPAFPLALERARRDVNTAFAAFDNEPNWFETASSAGLVSAALSALSRWLR